MRKPTWELVAEIRAVGLELAEEPIRTLRDRRLPVSLWLEATRRVAELRTYLRAENKRAKALENLVLAEQSGVEFELRKIDPAKLWLHGCQEARTQWLPVIQRDCSAVIDWIKWRKALGAPNRRIFA